MLIYSEEATRQNNWISYGWQHSCPPAHQDLLLSHNRQEHSRRVVPITV
jgi:hypothetical protein